MALQSSGTITIQDIADEFGGTAPHSLSEYYRNGVYVGSNNTGVPTSGTISLSDFYGASAATVVTVTEGSLLLGYPQADHFGFSLANKVPNYATTPNQFLSHSAFGARSPTTLNGATIQCIVATEASKTTPERFCVVVSGTRAQTFFTSVLPQGGTTLNTASANFARFSGSTIWVWYTSIPSGWNGSGTRTATFV
jgi:hypothetical protein